MRRWILKAGATNLDGLFLEEVAIPEPGPGEVRIRVHAVSLNYRDQLVLLKNPTPWRLPDRDLVPVSDGAGVIDAIGPGVDTWVVGDRVTGLYFRDFIEGPPHANMGFGLGSLDEDGMLSEYVVLPAKRVARAPASLDYAEAATLPCAALTAWSALYGDHPITPDSKVLVVGTGGVSLFALIFARAAGAQVFATTSQNAKLQRLLDLGVSDVVNYRDTPDWGKAVFDRTGGVNKVVDAAGSLNQSLAALQPGGEVAIMGVMTADGPPNPALLMGKGATVRGIAVGNAKAYEAMSQAIDTHQVKPPIDRRFHFEDAKDAYQAQSSPELFGKIVIELP
ncbi:NAD(P)-dependent alcohol dehydrogenase [Tolypothrix campylonemoides VB511288]|nr:NAD(P)-dependent alcohol dehydrogenase [Tolypothrix campylonemoides VB511288]